MQYNLLANYLWARYMYGMLPLDALWDRDYFNNYLHSPLVVFHENYKLIAFLFSVSQVWESPKAGVSGSLRVNYIVDFCYSAFLSHKYMYWTEQVRKLFYSYWIINVVVPRVPVIFLGVPNIGFISYNRTYFSQLNCWSRSRE